MSPAKKQDPSSVAPRRKGRRSAWLLALLGMMLLMGVIGGPYLAWRKLKPRILNSPEYRVGPEQVEITPAPAWIHSDIRAEVFRDPALDGPLSLMDDRLTEQIAQAFSLHPWVAKVTRVTKRHPVATNPTAVKVELVYRQPACMVEVSGGVLAVDAEGVLLPSEDFSPIEATRYPHLAGVDRKPAGPPGRPWGDAKVVGGAEIAAAFGPAWEVMRLQRIVPLAAGAAAAPRKMGWASRSAEPGSRFLPSSRAPARGSSGVTRQERTCWGSPRPPTRSPACSTIWPYTTRSTVLKAGRRNWTCARFPSHRANREW